MNLRKAAEQALEYFDNAHGLEDTEVAIKEALRQALAQPEREWVGLTEEEGAEIWSDAHDIDRNRLVTPKEIVRRIEAKLKEKNGG